MVTKLRDILSIFGVHDDVHKDASMMSLLVYVSSVFSFVLSYQLPLELDENGLSGSGDCLPSTSVSGGSFLSSFGFFGKWYFAFQFFCYKYGLFELLRLFLSSLSLFVSAFGKLSRGFFET